MRLPTNTCKSPVQVHGVVDFCAKSRDITALPNTGSDCKWYKSVFGRSRNLTSQYNIFQFKRLLPQSLNNCQFLQCKDLLLDIELLCKNPAVAWIRSWVNHFIYPSLTFSQNQN